MGSLSNAPNLELNSNEIATIIAALSVFTSDHVRELVEQLAINASHDKDHVLYGTSLLNIEDTESLAHLFAKKLRFRGTKILLFMII